MPEQTDETEQLHRIVDRMLETFGKTSPRVPRGLLDSHGPLDLSKPNQHDNKAEFLREKTIVETSLQHVEGLLDTLVFDVEDEQETALQERIYPVMGAKLRSAVASTPSEGVLGMLRGNLAEYGQFYATLWVFMDLSTALRLRMKELEDQEARFWSLPHRAPDYHARAVALRLAKLYARETGQRPTYGTSGETGDPSTTFSRALRDVFKMAGIKSGVRTYAEWAIEQLDESDLQAPQNALGSILGIAGAGASSVSSRNLMAETIRRRRGER
ncbi:hypothetical protein [Roseivivax sediminis]|uniref:hypothetical protein n=1 Tax=Roseivivax sediminis TaxID=936889 RepID=UPI00122C20E2|nr:hypothetical protein [Roseivivax sediminis]